MEEDDDDFSVGNLTNKGKNPVLSATGQTASQENAANGPILLHAEKVAQDVAGRGQFRDFFEETIALLKNAAKEDFDTEMTGLSGFEYDKEKADEFFEKNIDAARVVNTAVRNHIRDTYAQKMFKAIFPYDKMRLNEENFLEFLKSCVNEKFIDAVVRANPALTQSTIIEQIIGNHVAILHTIYEIFGSSVPDSYIEEKMQEIEEDEDEEFLSSLIEIRGKKLANIFYAMKNEEARDEFIAAIHREIDLSIGDFNVDSETIVNKFSKWLGGVIENKGWKKQRIRTDYNLVWTANDYNFSEKRPIDATKSFRQNFENDSSLRGAFDQDYPAAELFYGCKVDIIDAINLIPDEKLDDIVLNLSGRGPSNFTSKRNEFMTQLEKRMFVLKKIIGTARKIDDEYVQEEDGIGNNYIAGLIEKGVSRKHFRAALLRLLYSVNQSPSIAFDLPSILLHNGEKTDPLSITAAAFALVQFSSRIHDNALLYFDKQPEQEASDAERFPAAYDTEQRAAAADVVRNFFQESGFFESDRIVRPQEFLVKLPLLFGNSTRNEVAKLVELTAEEEEIVNGEEEGTFVYEEGQEEVVNEIAEDYAEKKPAYKKKEKKESYTLADLRVAVTSGVFPRGKFAHPEIRKDVEQMIETLLDISNWSQRNGFSKALRNSEDAMSPEFYNAAVKSCVAYIKEASEEYAENIALIKKIDYRRSDFVTKIWRKLVFELLGSSLYGRKIENATAKEKQYDFSGDSAVLAYILRDIQDHYLHVNEIIDLSTAISQKIADRLMESLELNQYFSARSEKLDNAYKYVARKALIVRGGDQQMTLLEMEVYANIVNVVADYYNIFFTKGESQDLIPRPEKLFAKRTIAWTWINHARIPESEIRPAFTKYVRNIENSGIKEGLIESFGIESGEEEEGNTQEQETKRRNMLRNESFPHEVDFAIISASRMYEDFSIQAPPFSLEEIAKVESVLKYNADQLKNLQEIDRYTGTLTLGIYGEEFGQISNALKKTKDGNGESFLEWKTSFPDEVENQKLGFILEDLKGFYQHIEGIVQNEQVEKIRHNSVKFLLTLLKKITTIAHHTRFEEDTIKLILYRETLTPREYYKAAEDAIPSEYHEYYKIAFINAVKKHRKAEHALLDKTSPEYPFSCLLLFNDTFINGYAEKAKSEENGNEVTMPYITFIDDETEKRDILLNGMWLNSPFKESLFHEGTIDFKGGLEGAMKFLDDALGIGYDVVEDDVIKGEKKRGRRKAPVDLPKGEAQPKKKQQTAPKAAKEPLAKVPAEPKKRGRKPNQAAEPKSAIQTPSAQQPQKPKPIYVPPQPRKPTESEFEVDELGSDDDVKKQQEKRQKPIDPATVDFEEDVGGQQQMQEPADQPQQPPAPIAEQQEKQAPPAGQPEMGVTNKMPPPISVLLPKLPPPKSTRPLFNLAIKKPVKTSTESEPGQPEAVNPATIDFAAKPAPDDDDDETIQRSENTKTFARFAIERKERKPGQKAFFLTAARMSKIMKSRVCELFILFLKGIDEMHGAFALVLFEHTETCKHIIYCELFEKNFVGATVHFEDADRIYITNNWRVPAEIADAYTKGGDSALTFVLKDSSKHEERVTADGLYEAPDAELTVGQNVVMLEKIAKDAKRTQIEDVLRGVFYATNAQAAREPLSGDRSRVYPYVMKVEDANAKGTAIVDFHARDGEKFENCFERVTGEEEANVGYISNAALLAIRSASGDYIMQKPVPEGTLSCIEGVPKVKTSNNNNLTPFDLHIASDDIALYQKIPELQRARFQFGKITFNNSDGKQLTKTFFAFVPYRISDGQRSVAQVIVVQFMNSTYFKKIGLIL